MSLGARVRGWFNRTGSETLGWALIVLGLFMLVLPGPGLLGMFAGVALLARHYTWAQAVLVPLEKKAVEAASYSVATIPRILVTVLGIVWIAAVGVVWLISPTIPEFSILNVKFGPELPGAGWVGAIGWWFSDLIAVGILVYSIRRWR